MPETRTFHFADGREETYEVATWPPPPPIQPIWERIRCATCNGRFTEAEWDARHDHYDGFNEVHEECCPECAL